MVRKVLIAGITLGTTLLLCATVLAQNEFAATLEVLNPGVEVQRVNTSNPIAVSVEAIVGVGDIIRTDETGEARITFFADGTDVTLESNTEYRIAQFEGDDEDFQLTVEVLAGQVTHRLNRALGSNSFYDVETPGMTLAARGTIFAVRVEEDGRSAILTREGSVDAESSGNSVDVPLDFGVRSEVNSPLSDVVRATSFDQLDSALDGCTVVVTTVDDVSLNVRLGPAIERPRVGIISAEQIDTFYGVSEAGSWYRLPFRSGFGWVLSSSAQIIGECAGLRIFPDDQIEDVSLYQDLGDAVDLDNLETPEATDEPASDS